MNKLKSKITQMLKQQYFKHVIILVLVSLISGCASSKKIDYFQETEGPQLNDSITNYEPIIQFGDILNINVSSLEPDVAIPFNIFESQNNGVARPLPYIVNANGNIIFPSIGKFKVSGLTITEITEELNTKLLPFLNDPIINIRLINFKVSVIGEVRAPGSYTVLNERINVIEALALAGDLTIYGERSSITLIREQNGKRTFIDIDITDKALFNSPYFYLTQNDIIYVKANKTRVNSSVVGPNTYILVSSLSILISLVAILSTN
jgi:polysaccharide export outer membrane protein